MNKHEHSTKTYKNNRKNTDDIKIHGDENQHGHSNEEVIQKSKDEDDKHSHNSKNYQMKGRTKNMKNTATTLTGIVLLIALVLTSAISAKADIKNKGVTFDKGSKLTKFAIKAVTEESKDKVKDKFVTDKADSNKDKFKNDAVVETTKTTETDELNYSKTGTTLADVSKNKLFGNKKARSKNSDKSKDKQG